jgi:hypothetical protein
MACGIRDIGTVLFCLLISFAYSLSQPVVDGDLSDAQYQVLATKQNNNAGFGPDIDVTSILYYPDDANSVLYLGLTGKLNTSSNDGIGLWLNFDGSGAPQGELIGTPLGNDLDRTLYRWKWRGMYMNFAADFEVDYMFAATPGFTSTDVFFDGSKLRRKRHAEYHGNTDQNGMIVFTDPNVFGIMVPLLLLFNNGGGPDHGWKWPLITLLWEFSTGQCMEAFAYRRKHNGLFFRCHNSWKSYQWKPRKKTQLFRTIGGISTATVPISCPLTCSTSLLRKKKVACD